MERTPLSGRTDLQEIVAGSYSLVFEDDLEPAALDLYAIDSTHVEAEIDLPEFGINRASWESEWGAERKLEILLHEFAHVEEEPAEPDHGPRFYERLTELVHIANAHQDEFEALFGTSLDFEAVQKHVVASVNQYTVEQDLEAVDERKSALRERFDLVDGAASD